MTIASDSVSIRHVQRTRRLKVLSILGFPKSGTTILGNLLGEIDGFFDMGEIERFWPRLTHNARCGCSEKLSHCPFWSQVLSLTFPDIWDSKRDHDEMQWRTRLSARLQSIPSSELGRMLFNNISEVSSAQILVMDATPDLRTARSWELLVPAQGVEMFFIHLVRDPRGSVFTRQSKRLRTASSPGLKVVTAAADSLRWLQSHLKATALLKHVPHDRQLVIRYEDFADRPAETLGRILELLDESSRASPLSDARTVTLKGNHTAGGNRYRLRRGEVLIERDSTWVDALRVQDRWLITSLTMPLLIKYGYTLTVPRD